jgi:cell division septal protein FtsQ|tara:strand:+ start:1409 stop:2077 length:669 start_codon:yes stop_codon:yes gene_type:complete
MKSSQKLYFLIFIFFIFSTYTSKNTIENVSIFFPIKEIIVENNIVTNLFELKSDLSFLKDSSLFFLNKDKIITITDNYDFISKVRLKKKYPNTLKIVLYEKIPVATQIIDKKKFYITKNNEKINFIDLEIYNDLPSIFGKYKNFDIFFNDLKNNDFKINEVKAFYYFDVGRWDILLKNEKVIKLPEKNYLNLLTKINLMLDDYNFAKYKIFDFRIIDQLILQ